MADFHFLRPWWLALLPFGVWLIWRLVSGRADGSGWSGVVDAALRPHVLAAGEVLRESRATLVAALAVWVLAIGALAGPAWERLPVPAFRSDEALVIALDLSRSMDAADLEPTRVARAKLKLLDLLDRRAAGQTALVVFSTHAFTVTPLTTDTRTIAALVTAVGSDIMPTQGSSAAAGLAKAGALLRQTGLRSGEILLIGDADVTPADLELAADLRREGFIVHVLAVGTEQGAPIGQPGGGFLTDAAGQVVIPRLDPAGLQRLAAAGGGRFARLATDDRDLDTLFPAPAALPIDASLDTSTAEEYEADVWRDRGSWLVLALLPLLVLGFRRGLLCAWLAWLVLPMPRAEAFEWADLWQRRDQRGYEAFATEHPERAAELFDDREWRGAAEYRAGRFAEAAATLEGIDSADGHYNRGNALAKAGQLEPAIAAYERALELDPAHEDAHYNRDLLEDFLEQNPDQRQPSQDSSGGEQDGEQQRDAAGEEGTAGEQARGEPSPGEQGDEADRPSDGQAQAGEGEGSEDSPPEDAEDEGGEQTDRQAAAAERGEDENGDEAVPGPEDVEQWASEQAAEQWLRRVPQDPGGLLRRKFLYQYQRLGVDQDGNPVSPEEPKPW